MRDDIAKSAIPRIRSSRSLPSFRRSRKYGRDMYMISAILRNRLENGAEHDIHTLRLHSLLSVQNRE